MCVHSNINTASNHCMSFFALLTYRFWVNMNGQAIWHVYPDSPQLISYINTYLKSMHMGMLLLTCHGETATCVRSLTEPFTHMSAVTVTSFLRSKVANTPQSQACCHSMEPCKQQTTFYLWNQQYWAEGWGSSVWVQPDWRLRSPWSPISSGFPSTSQCFKMAAMRS